MKRVYRSEENKVIAGIFGGVGEYLNVDPVILRLLGLLLCLLTAVLPFVIAYIVAIFIVPKRREKAL